MRYPISPPPLHATCGPVPYISAQPQVCRTCYKCSLSTLSETLVLLVFFCFLVVLFFSFAPSHLFFFKRKKPAFWHSLRRKGGENIKRRKRSSLTLARLSPTCGHVHPSQRWGGGGRVLVIEIRLPLFSTHQPSLIKTINYGSNEGSVFIRCRFPFM